MNFFPRLIKVGQSSTSVSNRSAKPSTSVFVISSINLSTSSRTGSTWNFESDRLWKISYEKLVSNYKKLNQRNYPEEKNKSLKSQINFLFLSVIFASLSKDWLRFSNLFTRAVSASVCQGCSSPKCPMNLKILKLVRSEIIHRLIWWSWLMRTNTF